MLLQVLQPAAQAKSGSTNTNRGSIGTARANLRPAPSLKTARTLETAAETELFIMIDQSLPEPAQAVACPHSVKQRTP
jgi:hypothetical protein